MRSRVRSVRSAWTGVLHATATQANFRIELAVGAAALAAAVWLGAALAPIVLACALVLALEMLNTAVEAAVDLVSPVHHDAARVAKDCAAGAVLVAAVGAVGVGLVTLGPPLLDRLGAGGL